LIAVDPLQAQNVLGLASGAATAGEGEPRDDWGT
jgi:hypothetical protein